MKWLLVKTYQIEAPWITQDSWPGQIWRASYRPLFWLRCVCEHFCSLQMACSRWPAQSMRMIFRCSGAFAAFWAAWARFSFCVALVCWPFSSGVGMAAVDCAWSQGLHTGNWLTYWWVSIIVKWWASSLTSIVYCISVGRCFSAEWNRCSRAVKWERWKIWEMEEKRTRKKKIHTREFGPGLCSHSLAWSLLGEFQVARVVCLVALILVKWIVN